MTKKKTGSKTSTKENDAVFIPEQETPSNEKTQIICILDRSGSMGMNNVIVEARGGFNNFLNEQKKLKDEATITVALFDDQYELLYDDVNIQEVEEITEKEWSPRGTTALYDAIGKTVNTVKSNHNKEGHKKPDKVLVCIVTDGQENASHEYNHKAITKLISDCEEDDWNFIYLAANQDAFAVGGSFGMSVGNTYNFTADAAGTLDMANVMSNATASYRGMTKTSAMYGTLSKNLVGGQGNTTKKSTRKTTKKKADEVDDALDNMNLSGSVNFGQSFGDGDITFGDVDTINHTGVDMNYTTSDTTLETQEDEKEK